MGYNVFSIDFVSILMFIPGLEIYCLEEFVVSLNILVTLMELSKAVRKKRSSNRMISNRLCIKLC